MCECGFHGPIDGQQPVPHKLLGAPATLQCLSSAAIPFCDWSNRAAHVQVCVGVIDGYLFVYLEALGAPILLMGACLAVICAIELPVFLYSGHILAFLGYNGSLGTALAAFCLRLTAYSTIHLAPSVWYVVPVEVLHGFTFGIAWTAGVNFCKREAPPGLQSSAQGLFSSTYFGLGRGIGGLLGGLLYAECGGAVMFRSALSLTLAAWAAVSVAEVCCSPRQRAPV